jgi:hypothetical protein
MSSGTGPPKAFSWDDCLAGYFSARSQGARATYWNSWSQEPQWEIAALYARHTPQSPRVLACWGAALQFSLSFFGGDLQPFISLPSTRGHHPEWKMHLGNRGKSASAARLNVEA